MPAAPEDIAVSETWSAPASLRMDGAVVAEAAGLAAIAQGAERIDLAPLTDLDSSAVAVLLSWRRAAQAANRPLAFANAAPSLLQIAGLYGVTELVFGPAAAGTDPSHRHHA